MSVVAKVAKPQTPGSWSELWDQTEALSSYTLKGIEYLEKVAAFAKERAAVEEEYASKLRALVKKSFKKKDEEELWKTVSFAKAFAGVVHEVDAVAAQHEVIAEHLKKDVSLYATEKSMFHRGTRKQILNELHAAHTEVTSAINEMGKAQKQYSKTFKEAEAAFLKYTKAEKNMEISRLDLEKAKNNSQMRNGYCEESKQTYAYQVNRANDVQRWYFEEQLPAILEKYKNLDLDRISDIRESLMKSIGAEADVQHIINNCHQDMKVAANTIDPATDIMLVVELFKTGEKRPPPFMFEDLGRPEAFLNGGGQETPDATLKKGTLGGRGKDPKASVIRKQSMHHKIFGGGERKGEGGEYGNLPPQQRARRLAAKIADLEKDREKTLQSRDGLSKMQTVYRQNPKLGNPSDCDAQLVQYSKEIEALTAQINHYRGILEEVNVQLGVDKGSDTPPSVRSYSSASGSTTINSSGSTSAHNSSHAPLASDDWHDEEEHSSNGVHVETEVSDGRPFSALGRALAKFGFEGTAEGTIAMKEGDEFHLVEKDEGDGWTRVRRMDNAREGFVPSSYLEFVWFNQS